MRQVFVGGCDRSGTTFLGNLIGSFEGVVCLPETHFIVEHAAKCADAEFSAPQLQRIIQNHRRYRIASFDLTDADWARVTRARDLEAFFDGFARSYAARRELPDPGLWVDHTPLNAWHFRLLSKAFPNALFIHIIRDGRAVAASLESQDWGPNTLVGAARFWERTVGTACASQTGLEPSRFLTVFFEELLLNFDHELKRIADFLRMRVDQWSARGSSLRLSAYHASTHASVGRAPDPSKIDEWKRKVSPREAEILEWAIGGMLRNLGYRLEWEHARPPTRIERIAMYVRKKRRFAARRRRREDRWARHLDTSSQRSDAGPVYGFDSR